VCLRAALGLATILHAVSMGLGGSALLTIVTQIGRTTPEYYYLTNQNENITLYLNYYEKKYYLYDT